MSRETVVAKVKAAAHVHRAGLNVRKPDIVRISSWGVMYCETRAQHLSNDTVKYIEVVWDKEPDTELMAVEW